MNIVWVLLVCSGLDSATPTCVEVHEFSDKAGCTTMADQYNEKLGELVLRHDKQASCDSREKK